MKRSFSGAFESFSKSSSDGNSSCSSSSNHSLKIFPWMNSLLERVKDNPINSQILFCIESSGGKRTSWGYSRRDDLYRYIQSLKPKNRNIYEIIPAGRTCRLFFDIDMRDFGHMNPSFPKNLKERETQIVAKMKTLIAKISSNISEDQLSKCILKRSHRVEGNDRKFSIHLIWPNIIFEDINNVGAFARRIMIEIGMEIETFRDIIDGKVEGSPNPLLIMEDNLVQCIIDPKVYSFNQNLRLLNCTKWGEERYFEMDGEINCGMFEDSCVAGFPSTNLMTFCESDGSEAINTKSTFVTLKANLSKMGNFGGGEIVINKVKDLVLQKTGVEVIGYEYFENDKGEGYLVFKTRSKVCSIAGKEHTSNKVYYVLNCQTMCFYQKCHDTLCANQRGDETILII